MNHFAVHLKLTKYYTISSATLQLKKKEWEVLVWPLINHLLLYSLKLFLYLLAVSLNIQ